MALPFTNSSDTPPPANTTIVAKRADGKQEIVQIKDGSALLEIRGIVRSSAFCTADEVTSWREAVAADL